MTRMRRAVTAGALVLVVGACAYDWNVPAADGRDAGTGTPFVPDASSPNDGSLPTNRDGGVAQDGCRSSVTCPADTYCRFPDGMCGGADGQPGTCVTKTPTCPIPDAATTSVCACNGARYTSACAAAVAGFDVSSVPTKCPAPPNTFLCGTSYCQLQTQFCLQRQSDAPKCVDLGSCDGGNLCSCAIAKSGGGGCTCTSSSGAVRVNC